MRGSGWNELTDGYRYEQDILIRVWGLAGINT